MRQAEFETHFLPYPASYTSLVDNARVSVLVESLLRMLSRHLGLQVTSSFKGKLNQGIKAREGKAKSATKRKGEDKEAEDDLATAMLEMSAARMRVMVDAAAAQ